MEDIRQDDLDKALKKFNWGAGVLGFFWSIVYGCFGKWFLHSLAIAAILGIIFAIAVWILDKIYPGSAFWSGFLTPFVYSHILIFVYLFYFGKKGNRWAWESKNCEKDIEKFLKTQSNWGIAARILFIFWLVQAFALGMIIYGLFLTPSDEQQSAAEQESYISAKTCKTLYDILPNAISTIKDKKVPADEWNSALADELEKHKGVYAFGFSVRDEIHFTINYDDMIGSEDLILKSVKDTPCSLSEGNCYLSAKTQNEDTACRFYYDDSGKVTASEKTLKFLNIK